MYSHTYVIDNTIQEIKFLNTLEGGSTTFASELVIGDVFIENLDPSVLQVKEMYSGTEYVPSGDFSISNVDSNVEVDSNFQVNSNSMYSHTYVIKNAIQEIQFLNTTEGGSTTFSSKMKIGKKFIENLDPSVLQVKEMYSGEEYIPSGDFGFNSIGMYTCSSNASYKKNTRENDAIIITGNPKQKIHITPVNFKDEALLTLDNDTLFINGKCKISGTITVNSNVSIVRDGTCKASKFITNSLLSTVTTNTVQNIKNIQNGLDTISKLEPKIYTKENDEIECGLIETDIFVNAPELGHLISTDAETKGINYIGLIPYLIQSIKELKETVKILENKINNMHSSNVPDIQVNSNSMYSHSYVIDNTIQEIKFLNTLEGGSTTFVSELLVGDTFIDNIDPSVLQVKEMYSGTEYTPTGNFPDIQVPDIQVNSNSMYSHSYVIDNTIQEIKFLNTTEGGSTTFVSELLVGDTFIDNLDPSVLQVKEMYSGTEYTPTGNFPPVNSNSLYYSHSYVIDNTIQEIKLLNTTEGGSTTFASKVKIGNIFTDNLDPSVLQVKEMYSGTEFTPTGNFI